MEVLCDGGLVGILECQFALPGKGFTFFFVLYLDTCSTCYMLVGILTKGKERKGKDC